jgi:hypothetical protein
MQNRLHKGGVTAEELQKIRETLLSSSKLNFERELVYRMGNRYSNATFACIKGDFGIEGAGDDAKAPGEPQIQDFFREVVQELEACNI